MEFSIQECIRVIIALIFIISTLFSVYKYNLYRKTRKKEKELSKEQEHIKKLKDDLLRDN